MMFVLNEKPYTIDQVDEFLALLPEFPITHTYETVGYMNVPASFDIETTSFYDENGDKAAIMYVWQFGINGNVIVGRTWEEFQVFIREMVECYTISLKERLVVYVHNLSFEFQFIRKYFEWYKVFATDSRTPLFAVTKDGIEFRCSYMLSGFRLEEVGNQLIRYKVKKQTGDLDYSLARTCETLLTDVELGYCVHDVLVVMAYIQEEIEKNENNIANVPYTKTGYVRRYCRKAVQGRKKRFKDYRALMDDLILDPEEYVELKEAFQGGFTHASAKYSGKVCSDVDSFDFTSSYPYVMLSEQFPMSKGRKVEIDSVRDLEDLCSKYCVLFRAKIEGLYANFWNDNYISRSKCRICDGSVTNNGRVVYADLLTITLTDVDYWLIKKTYKFERISVKDVYIYERGFLPVNLLKSIIKLYKDKTELKGVADMESEYLVSKGMLNATYGMMVTDIVRPEVSYFGGEWKDPVDPDEDTIRKQIEHYNKSKSRFLFYPWGVWVTAYARRNLWTGILSVGDDYIYSDTDSIKLMNLDKHIDYFRMYNEVVETKLRMMCEKCKINFDDLRPKTIKGVEKLIGVWDHETKGEKYRRFKTLGAKRYLLEHTDALIIKDKDGNKTSYRYSLTVSGVNKYAAIPWMVGEYGDGIFDVFDDDLSIPADHCGKLTHTYIDDEISGELVDYLGNAAHYEQRSGVHLEKAGYDMSLATSYIDYLKGYREMMK